MFINALEEKMDDIRDDDILIIEDSEDTKKITVGNFKKAITFSSDRKIESVKESIVNELSVSDQMIKDKVDSTANAYYSLVRNYEFLNSAYEELKEMFHDYINKTNNQTGSNTTNPVQEVPVITDISSIDGSITLIWRTVSEADGYIILQTIENEDGSLSTSTVDEFEIPIISIETGSNNNITSKVFAQEMKIKINDLEVDKHYTFTVVSYKFDENGNRNDKYSAEKEIICK